MLSYKLTEIKLPDLKNLSLFLLQTNIFKIYSQQILSTKSEQFFLQLLGKLIATVVNEIKS